MQPKKILRLPDIEDRTGLGKSSIYAKIKVGDFPQPVRLGARSIGFIEEEINNWIETRARGFSAPVIPVRKGGASC